MAFGVPSFTELHYKVFDLYSPFLALLFFFSPQRSLTGVEMRRKPLRDFSISSERKLEHKGGQASGNGQNLIYFRSFHKFFHDRIVVLIFKLLDWGITILNCIRALTQLPLCEWYWSSKQWIHLNLKPFPVLKWGFGYSQLSDYGASCQEKKKKANGIVGLVSYLYALIVEALCQRATAQTVTEQCLIERDRKKGRGAFQAFHMC